MTDVKPSAVSRILRMFAVEPASDQRPSRRYERGQEEDRIPTVAEIERKFAERNEAFFWTWQYPGQW